MAGVFVDDLADGPVSACLDTGGDGLSVARAVNTLRANSAPRLGGGCR